MTSSFYRRFGDAVVYYIVS